ncbi:nitrilase [Litorivivens lipolytica]|uniref:Nitrilase n=1 Tax=Litorivivens lipolytica TaxID=1524264 RepID=A0A7W4Z6N1_9GAMM|nr:carbon-nitrogen hydrolase family protein [Litorivivens lipolytica]MBB3047120.1 nitrilase [Litorivivens lipolytica]
MSRRLAALQMVSGSDVELNLQRAERLIREAATSGAELVVLPEAFAVFGDREALHALAEREAREAMLRQWLSAQAKENRVVLVGGTIPLASDDGRAWAACYVYERDGDCLGCYHKLHLFDADVGDETGSYRESRDYRPGERPLFVDTSLGRLGLAVCFDLRFPAQFQWLRDQGAELIAVPSAFTRTTGLAHWLPLLRARAIETQCLLVGANQGGEHSPTRKTSGGSVLVDAWGNVLAEAGFGEAVVLADWDCERQNAIRRQIPLRRNSRFSVSFDGELADCAGETHQP